MWVGVQGQDTPECTSPSPGATGLSATPTVRASTPDSRRRGCTRGATGRAPVCGRPSSRPSTPSTVVGKSSLRRPTSPDRVYLEFLCLVVFAESVIQGPCSAPTGPFFGTVSRRRVLRSLDTDAGRTDVGHTGVGRGGAESKGLVCCVLVAEVP